MVVMAQNDPASASRGGTMGGTRSWPCTCSLCGRSQVSRTRLPPGGALWPWQPPPLRASRKRSSEGSSSTTSSSPSRTPASTACACRRGCLEGGAWLRPRHRRQRRRVAALRPCFSGCTGSTTQMLTSGPATRSASPRWRKRSTWCAASLPCGSWGLTRSAAPSTTWSSSFCWPSSTRATTCRGRPKTWCRGGWSRGPVATTRTTPTAQCSTRSSSRTSTTPSASRTETAGEGKAVNRARPLTRQKQKRSWREIRIFSGQQTPSIKKKNR
mmetsp:Transcript_68518/g.137778  ORF Transcript_68518/g.137778 Transcript_68518/m.137778 type:complete len:270 (+) Transcript_68518:273-1082(+)